MIYAELSGGLGNQMFVYAFARAMGLCCQEPVTLIDRQDWKTGSPAHTALALQALHISSEVQFITDAGFAKQHLPVQNAAKALMIRHEQRAGLMDRDWHPFEARMAPMLNAIGLHFATEGFTPAKRGHAKNFLAWGYFQGADYFKDQAETIRAELLDLGFPEQVLDDLTAEEAAHMSGAVKVYTETEPLYEDETYREVTTSVWNEDPPPRWEYSSAEKQPDGSYRYTYRVYDLYEGFVTHVVVLVEEAGRQRAVVLHYAAIDRPFGDCLAEGMEIWPVWQGNEESWSPGGWYSGRLLCEKDGQSYAADFYSVESGSYETTNIFGTTQNTGMIAEWSRMRRGENTRAYLLYDAEMLTPELPSLYSWCNYVRQTKPVYPFRDALTLWHEWNTNGCYEKWQTSIQIWPPVEEETE